MRLSEQYDIDQIQIWNIELKWNYRDIETRTKKTFHNNEFIWTKRKCMKFK